MVLTIASSQEMTDVISAAIIVDFYASATWDRLEDPRQHDRIDLSESGRTDMAKIDLINCRDAGVDCDFQARASSVDEVMELCAEHAIREHDMKAFGPELYLKMRRCLQTLEEEKA